MVVNALVQLRPGYPNGQLGHYIHLSTITGDISILHVKQTSDACRSSDYGITGFLAAHIALSFLKHGWTVHGTLRSYAKRSAVVEAIPRIRPPTSLRFRPAQTFRKSVPSNLPTIERLSKASI
ncbi:hypothetical protein B9479_003564 [Cryptococcus floricola]|uniref:Uncharacterized protein n=1 Tax=Cryptococcus floricola TaxID=2591691 RepID=A0A5D3B0V7_9TREE|nr:hypothetical protein B9479_003564 [Cryptococcus floricola]